MAALHWVEIGRRGEIGRFFGTEPRGGYVAAPQAAVQVCQDRVVALAFHLVLEGFSRSSGQMPR